MPYAKSILWLDRNVSRVATGKAWIQYQKLLVQRSTAHSAWGMYRWKMRVVKVYDDETEDIMMYVSTYDMQRQSTKKN